MIIKIEKSPVKNKKYRVYLNDGKFYDFGLDGSKTFLDHHDKNIRSNYLKRHMSNKTEFNLISRLIPSPALYSAYLLWGKYTDINKNIDYLNKLTKKI